MSGSKEDDVVIAQNAKSVANAPLPAPLDDNDPNSKLGSILLFYQYKEPEWTDKEHKQMLKDVIALGRHCKVTGRGRVAPEGLNCTLSGRPNDIRSFCAGLRKCDPLFHNTDFKITDGIPIAKLFKSLSIRKTKELVAYGLAREDKAPSLAKFAGTHLNATEYHDAMKDKDTVIIDVRNAYESAIGHFQPPTDGAELVDPKMRNSIEFPKWLADERTQKKLHNKKVLMYCTGGIRCERATALLNQMSSINSKQCKPKGVYELQGGIERYVKTYPQGGFWKGKNYLFDRRMEQIPGDKSEHQADAEIGKDCTCVVCNKPWTKYRGKYACSRGLCGVPVVVCDDCKMTATTNPEQLTCVLCRDGYKAPQLMPDLVGMKRKAESQAAVIDADTDADSSSRSNKKSKRNASNENNAKVNIKDRLFLSRLPLTATRTKVAETLGDARIKALQWLTDKKTGAFYGSCIVQVESERKGEEIIRSAKSGYRMDKKKFRISFCQRRAASDDGGDNGAEKSKSESAWPPPGHVEKEYPPIGK